MSQIIRVALDGSGDFTTVQEAIDQVRVHPLEPVTILIKNGLYKEKIFIPDNKSSITLIGESKENTVISYNNYAEMLDENQNKIGTFKTASIHILGDDITVENLTIENNAGYGPDIGQAVALYVSGDRCVYKNVRLLGNQDTLYTGKGRHYFKDCYIEGHVDFIFGAATAVFDHCEIHSLRSGYITAASTPNDEKYGYVFLDCKLTSVSDAETVYLGRPWRPYAATMFIRTWMGPHIKACGWDNWRDESNEKTARYGEYKSSGPGEKEKSRVHWSRILTDDEVQIITLKNIFNSKNRWFENV
ncbi:pectin esterase [Anaerobacillus alkalilacustris]|uniref:Pectin esterase n=1 Tax=Anaerobacillus alkalilacustris TaxID=393763 RepID=A0A1S2LSM8_9BACI|nr:pectinesterase family protein [Anaerobacillus alkalilacustris]OIJ14677.1 pectin esterase [Anaerobacillus alkalilacustris]